jgi:hypothetical protein
MSSEEFEFLREYKELCLRYRVIVTTDSDDLYLCPVMARDIEQHIGHFIC